ncbi:hAT family C-terminal dimerization region [Popillia japonica]|uniref:HAT family C-terminal dimerization region n=1 Tax=Popillia japonica TaxID=7064 RepID=A0AAW1L528_POPJA
MDISELEACCNDLHLSLTDEGDSDINGIDLLEELVDLRSFITIKKTPLEILEYLEEFDLIRLYPNTIVALRILLTLPVTVASGERSFSKLKLISQSKVSNLAILSIESELADKLDYSALIDEFAKLKVRRVQL